MTLAAARSIDSRERRWRMAIRHHLAGARASTPTEVAADLVAFHATDPASVYVAAQARIDGLTQDTVSKALYDDRTLVRMLGMRRTMFVVPTESVAMIQHSSTDAVAARMRRVLLKDLATVVPNPDRWLDELGDTVVNLLRDKGEATGAALSTAEPRLRTKLLYAEDKPYGGAVTITSRVLNQLSAEGRIVRGRPGSGWTGSQYRWSVAENWLPDGVPAMTTDDARIELVRRWLARFGPATVEDVKWWTGWNLGDTRRALAGLELADVDLDGTPGIVLADDVEPVVDPGPWIALLPALDPTPMGWFRRDWYLAPDVRQQLFDRNGNIGPSIWCDGEIVGGWAQRADGEVVVRLLRDLGRERANAVAEEAGRLTGWFGGVRAIPRFRTPLEKELADG